MQAADKADKRELTSWKAIADFLEVSVRTAQRYEAELGLPVRRLGGDRGRAVAAAVEDLERWRRSHVTPQKWWQSPRFLRSYSIAVTAVALALAVPVTRDAVGWLSQGQPHRVYWSGAALVAADPEGRELWRKNFADVPTPDDSTSPWLVDIDADGRFETVVGYMATHIGIRDSQSSTVLCFNSRGEERWKIQPSPSVSSRREKFTSVYVLRAVEAFPSPEKDGTWWVAASFAHHHNYPSVALVVDSRGNKRGEYWQSGHIEHIAAVDLNKDGIHELLMAGTSLGTGNAVVRVFDPRKVAGAEQLPADHPNQLMGFEPGTEIAIVSFERSRLNKLLNKFNYAYLIGLPANPGERDFQVSVRESLTPEAGYLVYTIRPDLSVSSIMASDSLQATYTEHAARNPGHPLFGDQDLDALRRGYRVEWRGKPW